MRQFCTSCAFVPVVFVNVIVNVNVFVLSILQVLATCTELHLSYKFRLYPT